MTNPSHHLPDRKIPKRVPNSDVKQLHTPIENKMTRNAYMKGTKIFTVYCCPLDLCTFTIDKQNFKETIEAVKHL